jgi:hypothetical protein
MNYNDLLKFDYAIGVEVCKHGVASGKTCGKIKMVSDLCFWVESSEIGEFGMRGDSGSLIISSDLVVGILSSYDHTTKLVLCVKSAYLYQLKVLTDYAVKEEEFPVVL